MTGSTPIDALIIIFTLISLSGIAAFAGRVLLKAPARFKRNIAATLAEHRAMMATLATAHAAAPPATRDALARNWRAHRAEALRLDPTFDGGTLETPDDLRKAA